MLYMIRVRSKECSETENRTKVMLDQRGNTFANLCQWLLTDCEPFTRQVSIHLQNLKVVYNHAAWRKSTYMQLTGVQYYIIPCTK